MPEKLEKSHVNFKHLIGSYVGGNLGVTERMCHAGNGDKYK